MRSLPDQICTGCGSTKTIEEIRAENPRALACCPERKMVSYFCSECGWPRDRHRTAEEGLICPNQRKNKAHPRTVFKAKEGEGQ